MPEASSFPLVGVWLLTGTTRTGSDLSICSELAAVLLLCDRFIVSAVTGLPVQQLVLVSASSHFLIINS